METRYNYDPKFDGSERPPPYAPQQTYGALPQNQPPAYPGPNNGYPVGGYQQYPPPGTGYQSGYTHLPPYTNGANSIRVSQNVVVVGGCPACRVGALEEDFTVLGILLAILFFPIGIICCLAMRQQHCRNCGAVFG